MSESMHRLLEAMPLVGMVASGNARQFEFKDVNFPVVNITGDLIIRPGQFPSGFGTQSRQWFVNKLPSNFAMVQRLEAGMNAKRITLSSEDKIRYQKMLRDGRMNLTRQGVYDASMMNVLKRARCTVERTNFECSLSAE